MVEDHIWVAQLCYLHDIFTYLNGVNSSMQGDNITIIDAFEKISCFQNKMTLWILKMKQNK